MKIADVAKLSPTDRLIYWIKERHAIYERKRAGKPKPWTDDEVLQRFYFTNPYRENDKTTVWFRENVRGPLAEDPRVLMATVIFRWFNLIRTGEILLKTGPESFRYGSLERWNKLRVVRRLDEEREAGNKVFTGAYMINSPPGKRKLEAICDRIEGVWKGRDKILISITSDEFDTGRVCSLQEAHEVLTGYDGLGGFMAYEIVCDLRYTYLLRDATDVDTWANPGPGAIRGLYRLEGRESDLPPGNASAPSTPKDAMDSIRGLLKLAKRKLKGLPKLEMREIEHSLCEWDKYERARLGDGRMKRLYRGGG